MTFEPVTPTTIETIRARMPSDHPAATHPAHVEGPTPAQIARRLYAEGQRAAALACGDGQFCIRIVRVLTAAGIRIGEDLDLRPGAIDAVRAELRRLVEAAIASPVDPEHETAVRAETERCARQMGRARTESEGA